MCFLGCSLSIHIPFKYVKYLFKPSAQFADCVFICMPESWVFFFFNTHYGYKKNLCQKNALKIFSLNLSFVHFLHGALKRTDAFNFREVDYIDGFEAYL